MKNKELIEKLLSMGIAQNEIAYYLEMTRQSVAKIKNDPEIKITNKVQLKLDRLFDKNKEDIEKILFIDKSLDQIKEVVLDKGPSYIDAAYEGIGYMNYWLTNNKFIEQEKYHKYYFGHMNNFYPRYNQAALFMRDSLNRQVYPLVTFQIDYENNLIKEAYIESFKPEFKKESHDLSDVVFPIKFNDFIKLLEDRIKPKTKFLLFKDYIDDDWEYLISNVKKKHIGEYELYDLSRLFNFVDNQQPYYGPLIENVLQQFKVDFDLTKLLSDCLYRAKKIVEVVNIISLVDLSEKKHDKTSMMFDSFGLKRDVSYMKKERRKLKGEKNE